MQNLEIIGFAKIVKLQKVHQHSAESVLKVLCVNESSQSDLSKKCGLNTWWYVSNFYSNFFTINYNQGFKN